MRSTPVNTSEPATLRVAAAMVLLTILLACVSGSERDDQPRHGWWAGNGIVVPHDSFPTDCRLCHVEGSWNELRADFEYDHEQETGVALAGAHGEAKCLRCHNDRGPVQRFARRGCQGCHEDVHRGNLGDQCATCHGEDTWVLRDELAVHNRTRFPLVGAHAAAQCWTCHPGGEVGNWSRVDVSCTTCHLEAAAAVVSPDHTANGWTTACDRCHIPTSWAGAGFNHFAFALTGAHARADCSACHTGAGFTGIPSDCAGCHTPEYQQTTDPDHTLAGFPMACELCHDTNGWEGAIFSHASIGTGCATCHQQDYNNTTNPNHASNGISTNCEECHGTSTWLGARFNHVGIVDGCVTCHLADYTATTAPDHVATGISQACEQCHVTTTWFGASFNHQGVTNGCATCHQTDYNQTTSPNHVAAGFPNTCEQCHSTNSWTPSNFNHNFPINGGDHGGFDCIDCHIQPSNYQIFSCIDCHEHRQSAMDDKHSGVGGYSWNSNACYSCHPNGQE